ncbi:MAG: PAS domain-containing sensor histidine kinase [Ginsengibacter sp.]
MESNLVQSFKSFYLASFFERSQLHSILLLDKEGRILKVNAAFENAFGYTEPDLKGRNFSILFTDNDQKNELPKKELERVLATGQANDKNFLVSKHQGPVWVNGESVLLTDESMEPCILKVVQDIHTEKESEYIIEKVNKFNENVLMSITDVVIVIDEEFKVIKYNIALQKTFFPDISEVELDDFNFFADRHDSSGLLREKISDLVETRNSFADTEIPMYIQGKNYTFCVTGSLVSIPGSPEGILLVMQDITIDKLIEQEKEDIIGFVAHELRNPLAGMSLTNSLIRELIPNEKSSLIEKLLQRNAKNITRLNRMVTELYEATKITSGNFVLEIAPVNFDEVIADAMETIRTLYPDFTILVSGKGGLVSGDSYRLVQVVTNYLGNAIKYSGSNKTIELHVQADAVSVMVSVNDSGVGIPEKQLPYVFERFFRVDKTKDIEGLGIGLFFCKRIIEAHNGKVWVESQEGSGSQFYFSIPKDGVSLSSSINSSN